MRLATFLKAAVPLLAVAFLLPAATSATATASTSPKALFSAEQGGHWIVSQPTYRDVIQDRAIRYDSNWEDQEVVNLTGLNYVEVLDVAQSDLGSRAVLTDSDLILYNSEWEEQREIEISGSPEFLVAKQQNFHIIDRVREGEETNYYLQKVSYNFENFSTKQKLGVDLNVRAVDWFNGSWITISPASEGAQVTYYSEGWTKQREEGVELPGREPNSELVGVQASMDDFWVMTSEQNGFGGKIHRLTTEPAYTGTYYEIGLNSTDTRNSVVTTEELPWTLPMATVALIVLLMLGLAVIIALLLLLIGPYRTWKKHLKKEEKEHGQSGDDGSSEKEKSEEDEGFEEESEDEDQDE